MWSTYKKNLASKKRREKSKKDQKHRDVTAYLVSAHPKTDPEYDSARMSPEDVPTTTDNWQDLKFSFEPNFSNPYEEPEAESSDNSPWSDPGRTQESVIEKPQTTVTDRKAKNIPKPTEVERAKESSLSDTDQGATEPEAPYAFQLTDYKNPAESPKPYRPTLKTEIKRLREGQMSLALEEPTSAEPKIPVLTSPVYLPAECESDEENSEGEISSPMTSKPSDQKSDK